MKFTAPTAIPTPKMTPASVRLAPPSPKANIKPPTTIATRASPVAIGPVKAVCSTCTACVHGELPAAWANAEPVATRQETSANEMRRKLGERLKVFRELLRERIID